jgi:glutamyl-tRNA reductase
VAKLGNVFVFDVDDLEAVVASNLRERGREAERAELIVESEVTQFQQALRDLDIGPTVGALREKLRHIAREEFERQRPRLGALTPEQEQAIEAMLMSAVNKISHPVIHRMRRSYDKGEDNEVQAWRDIFGLEEKEP